MAAQTPAMDINPGSLGLTKAMLKIKVPPAAHVPAQALISAEMHQ